MITVRMNDVFCRDGSTCSGLPRASPYLHSRSGPRRTVPKSVTDKPKELNNNQSKKRLGYDHLYVLLSIGETLHSFAAPLAREAGPGRERNAPIDRRSAPQGMG